MLFRAWSLVPKRRLLVAAKAAPGIRHFFALYPALTHLTGAELSEERMPAFAALKGMERCYDAKEL